uniref:Transport permease protein n=1 Tax=Rathayibacter iranicus TaxID=59737 RepID=A0A5J6SGH5_9MICO|nr:ABC-type multidrug transport system permease [Rathayibacter iranicus]
MTCSHKATAVRADAPSVRFLVGVYALVVMQLTNWRWSWPQMLLTGFLAPVMTSLGLGLYAGSSNIAGATTYVVSGSITLAVMFETLGRVASNFAFMKQMGTIVYLSSFPIRSTALMLSSMVSFGLLAVPAVLVTTVVSAPLVGVVLDVSWYLLPLLALVMLPFVALGAMIGSLSHSLEEASSLTLAITVLMTGLGPIVIHPDLLPSWLVAVGRFNPATYASEIVRAVLFGSSPSLWFAVLVISAVGCVAIGVASFAMRWRR